MSVNKFAITSCGNAQLKPDYTTDDPLVLINIEEAAINVAQLVTCFKIF